LNLAIDEALLRIPGPPTLRFYGWSPPALSLGYFQSTAEVPSLPAGTSLVRRQTGGGGIHHQCELTLALALERRHLPQSVAESYTRLHRAVQLALADVGQASRFPSAATGRDRFFCFDRITPLDLVDGANRKVFGAAQRRHANRILHHGSLPLAPSPLTPGAGHLRVARNALEAALIERLSATLGVAPISAELTNQERELAERLAIERFGAAAHTYRR
jgi:lipoate-protein ligase A